jgi:hypothetical protein
MLGLVSLVVTPGASAHVGHHEQGGEAAAAVNHLPQDANAPVEAAQPSNDAGVAVTAERPQPARDVGCLGGCCTAMTCGVCCAALVPVADAPRRAGAFMVSLLPLRSAVAGIGRMPDVPPPRSRS